MERRTFFLMLGVALTLPRFVPAQQRSPVIGFLGFATPSGFSPSLEAFRDGLREAGYVEGQNVTVEYRWAEGDRRRLPNLAAELVGSKVDVIFTSGGVVPAMAAKEVTTTIPIVFEVGVDPVERGLVASYARPGGNLTGVTILTGNLMQKRLEVITELVPQAHAIALLVNPNNAPDRMIEEVEGAGRDKNVVIHVIRAATEDEFEPAFASIGKLPADALLVGNDPYFFSRRDDLVKLAQRYSVPAIYEWRDFVVSGGLVSYGTSLREMSRQAGLYVGRILSGAKPADLPIVQPTKFELVINLKTAKALGLTIPPAILSRADDLIE
jgi:putative ABC transport system substrate-binding protein